MENIQDVKEIIKNIEHIYGSNNSLGLLKDFERVLDNLDVYVFDNWLDGELVSDPIEHRYFIECVFMWPEEKMPNPQGGARLLDYGCKVEYGKGKVAAVRQIKRPEDIRPGTKKGKIDYNNIWKVKIIIPKKLIHDIHKGYSELDRNKIEDIINQFGGINTEPELSETSDKGLGSMGNMNSMGGMDASGSDDMSEPM